MGNIKQKLANIVEAVVELRDEFKEALMEKGVTEPGDNIAEYPAAILEIPTGGGGGDLPYNMNRVRYWDIDGTLLKEEVVEDGQSSTPPENRPNIPEAQLNFVGWSATAEDLGEIYCDIDVIAEYEATGGLGAAFFVDVPVGETIRCPLYGSGLPGSQSYLVKWSTGAEWTEYSPSDITERGVTHTYSEGYRGWVLVKRGTTQKLLLYGDSAANNAEKFIKLYVPVAGEINDTNTTTPKYIFWPDLEGIYVPKSNASTLHYMGELTTPRLKWIYNGSLYLHITRYTTIVDGEFVISPYVSVLQYLPFGNYKTAFCKPSRVDTGNTNAYSTATIGSLYCPTGYLDYSNGSIVVSRHLYCQSITGSTNGKCAPMKLIVLCATGQTGTYGNGQTNKMKRFILKFVPTLTNITLSSSMWPECYEAKIIPPEGSVVVSATNNVNVHTLDESFWIEFFTMLSAPSSAATLNIPTNAYNAISASTKAIATDKGYSVSKF